MSFTPRLAAVPLGPQQVTVHDVRVMTVAGVDAGTSDLGVQGMDLHVKVVDVTHGVAWLIPMSRAYARRTIEQIAAAAGFTVMFALDSKDHDHEH